MPGANVQNTKQRAPKIIDHATEDGKLFVSVEEFSALTGCGRTSAYAAVQRGDVRSVRIGKKICIPVREVERLLSGVEAA